MLRHIVIRSLMIIPTLWVVSIVAFVLSVSTPNDPIEQSLTLEGVTYDDELISVETYNAQYDKKARDLGKDKPLFYITIQPNYYPHNEDWADINIRDRKEIKNLMKDKISLESAVTYIDEIKIFENSYFLERDHLSAPLKKDWKRSLTLLRKPSQILDIRKQLIYLANEYQDTPYIDNITALLVKIPTESANRLHYPTIHWNGLDNQYHHWVSSFVVGEYGVSILDAKPVYTKIWGAIKWTSLLIILSIFFSLLIAIPLSVISAYKVNSKVDHWISGTSMVIYSIPVFWMATLLIVYFTTDTYGEWFDIFPSPASFYSEDNTSIFGLISKYFNRLILPVICISMKDIAYITRIIRADLVKESSKEYATTLRAKGLAKWATMWKHILPNALISTVTIIISSIPLALSGALIIEVIFNIPGMGRLMYNSISQADWNVVYAILMLISLVTVIFYLLGDIIYSLLNPRITFNGNE